MPKKILLIDGNSLIYRAYFANSYRNQTILRTSDGVPTNAVYSFINMLLSLLGKENYDEVKVAFDAGKQTFRHQKMPGYKAKRSETPSELLTQLPIARDFLDKIGIQWFALTQFEADDIIACLNQLILRQYPDAQIEILTSDRDLYQLISKHTQILVPRSGTSDLVVMDEKRLQEEWQTKPQNVPDLKGLMGDNSDNLSGVPGIGEKTATHLIGSYHTLENIYQHLSDFKPGLRAKLEAGKEAAFFTREMATLNLDCPLSELKLGGFELNLDNLKTFLERYEMKSILRRLGLSGDQEQSLKQLKIDSSLPKIPKLKMIQAWNSDWNDSENTIYVESLETNYHEAKIIGISIFNRHGLFYWDWNWENKQLALFELPSTNKIDAAFNQFLESAKFQKGTYDLKKTLTLLTNAGYQPNPYSFNYDMMLAAYDLEPTVASNFSNHIQLIDPKEEILNAKEFFGSAINPKLRPKIKADYISRKAVLIAQTKPQFLAKLESYNLLKIYQKLDLPLAICLFHIEQNGLDVKRELIESQLMEFGVKMEQLEQKIKGLLPKNIRNKPLNLASPQQIQHLLFDELKLPDNFKGSTNHVALSALVNQHPLVSLILQYRNLDKWRSSLNSFKRYVKPDDKVHTFYNQTAVVTGRISSNEPNLQAVAVRDETQKELRKIFVAPPGWGYYSFDYSQIELRVLSVIAPEPHLLSVFLNNKDPHLVTAQSLFNLKPSQTPSSEQRRLAKVFNFGIIYGLTPYGLSQELNLPLEKAKSLTEAYYQTFPGIKNYQATAMDNAQKLGYSLSFTRRRRLIPELKSSDYHLRQTAERIAINSPAQTTSADIIKMAMVEIDEELYSHKYQTQMVAQIHDELIFNIPNNEVKQVVPMIRKKMEQAFQSLAKLVDSDFKVKVPLKVTTKFGPTWYELK